jgi:hypothetical protein
MEYVIALIVLGAVVLLVVLRPLLFARAAMPSDADQRAALEAAKEVKYREIREAELDYRTGKLSEDDWRRTDAELRRQAIELLKKLDSS